MFIQVKNVDDDGVEYIDMFNASLIKTICYVPSDKKMFIVYTDGKNQTLHGVSKEEFDRAMAIWSPGLIK